MDEVAATSSSEATGEMVQCILPLYRSAIQPICAELGARLAALNLPAGLAIHATADAYVGYAVESAATLGAAVARTSISGNFSPWLARGSEHHEKERETLTNNTEMKGTTNIEHHKTMDCTN